MQAVTKYKGYLKPSMSWLTLSFTGLLIGKLPPADCSLMYQRWQTVKQQVKCLFLPVIANCCLLDAD